MEEKPVHRSLLITCSVIVSIADSVSWHKNNKCLKAKIWWKLLQQENEMLLY